MNILETGIPDLKVIEPKVFEDHRGYFFESFSAPKLATAGIDDQFVQDNESKSQKYVLRGLHYQINPTAMSKLVRVVSGSVLDVAVDIREGSPTYGKWFSIELSAANKKQLYIPRGFAHGFVTLEDNTIFCYKCDNFYSKEDEGGIRFDDPTLSIDWEIDLKLAITSEKDDVLPNFGNHKTNFKY